MLDGVHGRTTAITRKWCFMGTHNYSPHAAVIHCLTREINWLIIRWENYLSPHRAPWFFNTFALLCTAPHSLKPPLFYVPPLQYRGILFMTQKTAIIEGHYIKMEMCVQFPHISIANTFNFSRKLK